LKDLGKKVPIKLVIIKKAYIFAVQWKNLKLINNGGGMQTLWGCCNVIAMISYNHIQTP